MRLLNTSSFELKLFIPSQVPDYVILSHRWSFEEVTFEDITKNPISDPTSPARLKQGFSKVQGACELAARDGYDWIWIDSCNIDKSSSAELQEAINSMWNYYANSNICYVYMADVPDSDSGWGQTFKVSEWFSRSWTLQELIAPVIVEFYAKDWTAIGTKSERYREIAKITTVDPVALLDPKAVVRNCAARRLSWAAHRQTTREEDESYSLLGLFQVNIPMLYGEGRKRAFARLQDAVYNSTKDQSLFLFSGTKAFQPLLAESVLNFCQREDCASCKTTSYLPLRYSYASIIPSWEREFHAHESMTTATSSVNQTSVTLTLASYRAVCDDMIAIDHLSNVPTAARKLHIEPWMFKIDAAEVAILDCTLGSHAGGALCLLLCPMSNTQGAFLKASVPALLLDVRKYARHFRKSRIVILSMFDDISPYQDIHVTFEFYSSLFSAQAWVFKRHNGTWTRNEADKAQFNTKIRLLQGEFATDSIDEAACDIVRIQSPTHQLRISLGRVHKAWFIREIRELGRSNGKQGAPFRPSAPSDRCSICLSDETCLDFAVRRLAAEGRLRDLDEIPAFRYQITVTESSRNVPSHFKT